MWTSINYKSHAWGVLAAGLALLASAAHADTHMPPVSLHGFASVGYIATTGNNFYGNTLHGGALDYYEAGVNAYKALTPNLSLAGQVLSRKAGATDDGRARVDYGFVDWHTTGASVVGVRVGRVKNPMGLHNQSRDVLSTRPSILLPQSVYHEGTGVRELLFSSDGVQLYGDHTWPDAAHQTTLQLNVVAPTRASGQTERNFTALAPTVQAVKMEMGRVLFVQAVHDIDQGRQRYALGYIRMPIDYDFHVKGAPVPFVIDTRSGLYLLSAQYNLERWSLTGEARYTRNHNRNISPLPSTQRSQSRGGYLQLDYRFDERWAGFVRRDYSGKMSGQSSSTVGIGGDTALGLSWKPAQAWHVNAEYHRMSGSGMAPPIDNLGRTPEHQTRLLALMVGYQF